MDKETFKSKIELYLNGQLSANDKDVFENYLINNPELQEEVDFYNTLEKAVVRHGRKNKLVRLTEIQQSAKEEIEVAKIKRRRSWIIYGTAAIFLLLLGSLFVFTKTTSDPVLLMSQEFEIRSITSADVLGSDVNMDNVLVNIYRSDGHNFFRSSKEKIEIFVDKTEISGNIKIFRYLTTNEYLLIINADSLILKEINE